MPWNCPWETDEVFQWNSLSGWKLWLRYIYIFFARSKAGKQEVDSADVVFIFLPLPTEINLIGVSLSSVFYPTVNICTFTVRGRCALFHINKKKSRGIGERNFYCLLLALQKSRRLWESAFSALCIHPSPACKKDCLFLLDNTRKTIEIYEWMQLCLLTLCSLMLALPSQACRWAPWH